MLGLVDTGAQITIVNEAVLDELQIKVELEQTKLTITGPSKSHCLDIKGIANLSIEIAGYVVYWPTYVCTNLSQSLLIGKDLLKAYNAVIDLGSDTLRLNGNTAELHYSQTLDVFNVNVGHTVIIPARTVANIACSVNSGHCNDGYTGVLEPANLFEEKYQTGIIKVVATCHEGKIPVRVFNPKSEDVKIWKGSTVGKFHPLLSSSQTDSTLASSECYFVQCSERKTKSEPAAIYCNQISNLKDEMKTLFPINNPNISNEEKDSHYELLARHQSAISFGPYDIGTFKETIHKIDTERSQPVKIPVRRMAPAKRSIIKEEVNEMLENRIIEDSTSPWSAPVVIVYKKDGGRRFCVDYRGLNAVTKKDVYPLPRPDDILESLNDAKYFSHFDLLKGYWQVNLDNDSKEKTTFSTPDGHYQFRKLPFGLTNSPSTFQRGMDIILKGLVWTDCLVYLDDIIIFASSLQEHKERMERILTKFEEAGVKIKPSKCELLPVKMRVLGHVISTEGLEVDASKVEIIQKWPIPSNISELRSFLGHAGYYQRFIPMYSEITAPLRQLEKKNSVFNWNSNCTKAFKIIKDKLCSAPVLAFPRYQLPFIVDVDASDNGLGATLSQLQEGEERPIAYAARALQGAHKTYTVYQKEMLGLAWALDHFEPYVYGQDLKVRTDNSALSWLKTTRNTRGPQARWLERIVEFLPFEVEHRPGRIHSNADGLSRFPWERSNTKTDEEENQDVFLVQKQTKDDAYFHNWSLGPLSGWNDKEIINCQASDEVISKVTKWVKQEEKPTPEEMQGSTRELWFYWSQFHRLVIRKGKLYRIWWEESPKQDSVSYQLILPRTLVKLALYSLHDCSGHMGNVKTITKIRERFHWFHLREDVELYIRQCVVCQETKSPRPQQKAPMRNIRTGFPMERLGIDIVGPLPQSEMGNKYITVVTDYFTKFPFAFATNNITAETVAEKVMDEISCCFGVPNNMHSDQGSNFESNTF